MTIMERVGRNVKHRRAALGWTQQELAGKIGTSRIYVAQVEAASKQLSLEMLDRFARALRTKPGALLR